jgi:hypothetical protein
MMVLFTTMLSFSTKGLLNDIKYRSQNLSIVISGTSTLHEKAFSNRRLHLLVSNQHFVDES